MINVLSIYHVPCTVLNTLYKLSYSQKKDDYFVVCTLNILIVR